MQVTATKHIKEPPTATNTITPTQRHLPHELRAKYHACRLYRSAKDISFVRRRYHISWASLFRWIKVFDGTKESLQNKSHRPITPHPKAHTAEKLTWIRDLHHRNPNISLCELYGKLRMERGYSRHPGSLYRVFKRLGDFSSAPSTKKTYKPKPYNTPKQSGIKRQTDVKYVPATCYHGQIPQKFYQAPAVIDEAFRERIIYPYMEQSSHSPCDFFKRAILL